MAMYVSLWSMPASAYAANVVSLDTNAGFAGSNVVVALRIANDSTLAGLQFTIRDTPNLLILKSVTTTSRLSSFPTPSFNDNDTLGVATILCFTFGAPIAIGSGDVLLLTFEISTGAPPGDISLTFDQIALAHNVIHNNGVQSITVESSGVPGAIKVLDPVALTPHPAGQPANKFDQTAQAIDQDLFRFGMTNSAYPFRLTGLTFDIGYTQLSDSDLTSVQIFEDTNGDGTPDGSSFFSNISINGSNITVNGLDILIPAETIRYYVLRGTVALNQVEDQISLSIPSDGVIGNIEDATLGNIPARADGIVPDAVHTATGFTGDVTFDLSRNIIDVVKIVGVLLGNITMDGETSHYDINKDTLVDITDVSFSFSKY
ncbi:MAG TPA: hypothetical protein DIT99_20080 [Candidatus Latescibacteria bacterium]|nr:hypothetical protein [Candidatus Latescibacterota bacterium]